MNRMFTLLYLISLFAFFISCEETGTVTPIPAYIEIQDFELQHENAIGISDVWVNVDGEFIGVFEIPAKFPVIAEGSSNVSISAGIKVNGIGSTRTFYPFYNSYERVIDFKPSEVISLSPLTTYQSWTKIKWEEGFENGHKFEKRDVSDTAFVITDQEKFKDSFSGAIFLDEDQFFFESYTPQLSHPDFTGSPGMYIELNYKCNSAFEIGLYAYYQEQVDETNIILINPSDEWKKIYIDLYNPLLKYPEDTPYRIYIAAWKSLDQGSCAIFIDDFKIIQNGEK